MLLFLEDLAVSLKKYYITPPCQATMSLSKNVIMCFYTSKVYSITARCNVHPKGDFFKLRINMVYDFIANHSPVFAIYDIWRH